MIATLIDGHDTASDVLLLIAVVLFVIEALRPFGAALPAKISALAWGLACFAAGVLVA